MIPLERLFLTRSKRWTMMANSYQYGELALASKILPCLLQKTTLPLSQDSALKIIAMLWNIWWILRTPRCSKFLAMMPMSLKTITSLTIITLMESALKSLLAIRVLPLSSRLQLFHMMKMVFLSSPPWKAKITLFTLHNSTLKRLNSSLIQVSKLIIQPLQSSTIVISEISL